MIHQGRVTNAFFHPEGRFMATLERTEFVGTQRIRVWEHETQTTNWKERLSWRQAGVTRVLFSPRGKYVVTPGREDKGDVVIWDVAAKQQLTSPPVEGRILAIAFSADEETLVLAGPDVVRWWRVSEQLYVRSDHYECGLGLCEFSLNAEWFAAVAKKNESGEYPVELRHTAGGPPVRVLLHPAPVSSMTFAHGRYLATTTRDGITRVWGTKDAKEASHLAETDFAALAFMPGSGYLATATRDGAVKVWAAATGFVVARMRHDGRVQTLAFSQTGAYLATAADDRTARVWESMTGREILRIGSDSTLTSAVFSPDAGLLVTTGVDRNAHIWKMPVDPPSQDLGSGRDVIALSFNKSGRLLLKTTRDGSISTVDVRTGVRHTATTAGARLQSSTWSPDGQRVVTVDTNQRVFLWNLPSGTSLDLNVKNVKSMSFNGDGSRLAVAGSSGVQVFNTDSTVPVTIVTRSDARKVALSPDARYAAAAHREGRVRILAIDKEPYRKVGDLFFGEDIRMLAFDRYSKYLAAVDADGEVRLLEIDTGREIGPLIHGADVLSLAFSADGKRLATMADDRTARVWNVATGGQIAKISHDGAIKYVAFTNGDREVVTVSLDGTARKWEIATSTEISRMRLGAGLSDGVFTPDAQYLATIDRSDPRKTEPTIYLRSFDPKDLLTEACLRLTRNLTYQEWTDYFPREEYRKTCDNLPVHPTLVTAGKDLAKSGDPRGARKLLRRAVQLDPSIRRDIDPEKDLPKLAVRAEIMKGVALARRGRIKDAVAAFTRAQSLDPQIKTDENWTLLCWYGGLWGARERSDVRL
jgi:WD40 repeat protein